MKSILQSLSNGRMRTVLLFGFSSGLPLSLSGSALQAWMATQKVDLGLIGIFSLVSLPYTLKFLWSPLLDRFTLPFMGRRRGWILLFQGLLFFAISAMAFCDPIKSPILLAISALLMTFFSASQDIVIDAYKTEILFQKEYGLGAAVANFGYRVAMIFSSAGALILADHVPWRVVYLLMAGTMIVGIITTLFATEPILKVKPPKTLKEAVIDPFLDFFSRKGSLEVLGFVIVYKMDVVMTLALMTPFLLQLGFTQTDIGVVTKGFGLVATLVGTFAGGVWLFRLGIKRSLWIFGILQGISGTCFYLLAKFGYHYPLMVAALATENFFSGMGNAAYSAFLMSLCNPRFTATQFALLTSLMALTRSVAVSPAGWLVKLMGWEQYYLLSLLMAFPGLLLLTRYNRWNSNASSG
jgi:MFS transporter, PAT family, beta-lactamase induction signal transducer AmpG